MRPYRIGTSSGTRGRGLALEQSRPGRGRSGGRRTVPWLRPRHLRSGLPPTFLAFGDGGYGCAPPRPRGISSARAVREIPAAAGACESVMTYPFDAPPPRALSQPRARPSRHQPEGHPQRVIRSRNRATRPLLEAARDRQVTPRQPAARVRPAPVVGRTVVGRHRRDARSGTCRGYARSGRAVGPHRRGARSGRCRRSHIVEARGRADVVGPTSSRRAVGQMSSVPPRPPRAGPQSPAPRWTGAPHRVEPSRDHAERPSQLRVLTASVKPRSRTAESDRSGHNLKFGRRYHDGTTRPRRARPSQLRLSHRFGQNPQLNCRI